MHILFEDEHLIAINKESGLLVHPDPRDRDAPSAMKLLRDQIQAWVYPIHRLDRATSGILLFAKNSERAHDLATLFETRDIFKRYYAWTRGWLPPETVVEKPLAKSEDHEARPAETLIRCLGHFEIAMAVGPYTSARYSFVECIPKTGRFHQIRRHLSHLRYPILGDTNHGDNQQNRVLREIIPSARLMLHACQMKFVHPVTNVPLELNAPVPDIFTEFLGKLSARIN